MDDSDDNDDETAPIQWDIHRKGRRWKAQEFDIRADRLMELKFEIYKGKLFWSEETRRMILAMLLENVGMDAAVRLGDLALWKEAIAAAETDKTLALGATANED